MFDNTWKTIFSLFQYPKRSPEELELANALLDDWEN